MNQLIFSLLSFTLLPCLPLTAQLPSESDPDTEVQSQIKTLRDEMKREMDDLRRQIIDRDTELARLRALVEGKASEMKAAAPVAIPTAPKPAETQIAAVPASAPVVEPAARKEEPNSIRYRGVELRPTGFLAFEGVYRTRSMSADLNTPFNTTPYNGSGTAHVSEWNPSGRQSRFGLLAQGKVGSVQLSGYLEGDFLGVGSASNNNQTNSYVLRLRQAFGQISLPRGTTLTAGQTWTLATENTVGTDARMEATPQNIDSAQHLGFNWVRQATFRVQQRMGQHVTAAVALEQAQTIFNASNAPANFFFGSVGSAPGLYNPLANYTASVSPDVIGKVAYDRGRSHSEAGGMLRFFRDRYYPNAAATLAQNDTAVGGGFFISTHFPVTSKLDFGAKTLMGVGVGRYGAAVLPDVTVYPDGRMRPIRGAQGFLRAEYHWSRKLDLLAYAGAEYAQRTYSADSTGTLVGYAPPTMDNSGCNMEQVPAGNSGHQPGTPANCAGSVRSMRSASVGYQYRFYEGTHGRLQYGIVYTYLTKDGWTGVGGAPKATNNMVFTSLRYVLP